MCCTVTLQHAACKVARCSSYVSYPVRTSPFVGAPGLSHNTSLNKRHALTVGLTATRKRPPNRPIVVVFSFKTAGCLADQAKLFKSDSLLLLLSCFSNHTSPPLTKGQLSYLPSFIYSISRRGVGCQNQPIFRSNASSFKKKK